MKKGKQSKSLRRKNCIGIPIFLLMIQGCIALYVPENIDNKELLVVQGMITDNESADTVKLFRSFPLGKRADAIPVTGAKVAVSDNTGKMSDLEERLPGIYVTPEAFRGQAGLSYKLLITDRNSQHYESDLMEMIPVPEIDSLYYEKVVIAEPEGFYKGINACRVFIDTRDPANNCKYFRWDFSETWMFRLNFSIRDSICWINNNSHEIDIKSTAAFAQSKIERHQIKYISNETDRLKVRYSIRVNQYSLNEDEYVYWEKMSNIVSNVGGLYDMIPGSLPNNLHCIENPDETVLGYFSVSAKSSKRIFIQNEFAGIKDRYEDCVTDTVYSPNLPGLNETVWILITYPCSIPCQPYYLITNRKECSACTLRGTRIKPAFWTEE
ncbi:MAG TPA: DUF4249 domain-containing protein [Bacteroidales bacterium]|nr:DUF4249 domain-containing protein [Bacteroidales bacterium]